MLTYVYAGPPCNLALAADMQIKELALRMGHAANLRDATDKSCLVPRVIVTNQTAPPFTQEGSGVFFCFGLAEVKDHRFQILKRSKRIGPEIRPVCFLVAGLEHLYWRLIRMQHRVAQNLSLECIHQRLQLHATDASPMRQGQAWQRHSGTTKKYALGSVAANDRCIWPPAPGPANPPWRCLCQ